MATKAIEALEDYVGHVRSAIEAPLKRLTNQQGLTIFKILSEIDGLHATLRLKVQDIQQQKERKVANLLNRTASHLRITANLEHIYGAKQTASQITTRLRSSPPKVVRRWTTTIGVGDWDNGEMSAEVGLLAIAKMETMEDPDITTEELEVFEAMSKGDLIGSQVYMNFYSILLPHVGVCGFDRLAAAILTAYTRQSIVFSSNLCTSLICDRVEYTGCSQHQCAASSSILNSHLRRTKLSRWSVLKEEYV
jgi:predicted transcriptional regulator with HTH domain